MIDLNEHAVRAVADSHAWFPDVWARPITAQFVHLALGLIGEIGELDAVIFGPQPLDVKLAEIPGEVADTIIYCCELGHVLDLDLNAAVPRLFDPRQTVVVTMGALANAAKKLHRYTTVCSTDWAEQTDIMRVALVALLHRSLIIAKQYELDLDAVIDAKRAFNVGRWGEPDHPPRCNCVSCCSRRARSARGGR